MRHSLIFVVTTPFAVNAFLRLHLIALAKNYNVILCVNTSVFFVNDEIADLVKVCHIDIVRKINLLQDFRVFIQLLFFCIKFKPSVVHSITPKAGLLALLASTITLTPHRWHTFTGQVWATKTGSSRFLLKKMDRLIVLLASRIFADSASQCQFLCNEGIVRQGQVDILGNGSIAGVDLRRFYPNPIIRKEFRLHTKTEEGACVFLFVGRLVRDKGIFDLVSAFQQLAYSETSIELWVAGPDEDGLLQSLKKITQNNSAQIHWFNFTSFPENLMCSADVLVLPSYREGFGSVIVEAAACGIPAIAYRIDGVIDAVLEGESGLLIESGQCNELSNAMKLLACNEELRRRLGHQAKKRVEEEFDSEGVTHAWLNFYQSQLS